MHELRLPVPGRDRPSAITRWSLCGLPDVFTALEPAATCWPASSTVASHRPTSCSPAVLDLPILVVAAMAGHAIGGGLALGLCADIILLSRESRYGASFMNMGFTPGMGITKLLEHVMSPAPPPRSCFPASRDAAKTSSAAPA